MKLIVAIRRQDTKTLQWEMEESEIVDARAAFSLRRMPGGVRINILPIGLAGESYSIWMTDADLVQLYIGGLELTCKERNGDAVAAAERL